MSTSAVISAVILGLMSIGSSQISQVSDDCAAQMKSAWELFDEVKRGYDSEWSKTQNQLVHDLTDKKLTESEYRTKYSEANKTYDDIIHKLKTDVSTKIRDIAKNC